MDKQTLLERLTIADSLISSVWEEMRKGHIESGIGQTAVNIQVNVNRIVWKLNELMNAHIDGGDAE